MVPAMADDLEFPSCENCAAIGLYVAPMLRAMEAEIGVEETRAFLLAHGGRDYRHHVQCATGPSFGHRVFG